MEQASPTGFGRPCDCGKPMLPSLSGHGYCLACGLPSDDFPLVPASATTKEFSRVRRAWQRRSNRFCIVPSSKPAIQQVVDEERGLLASWSRTSTKGRVGRPRALTGIDVQRLGQMVTDQPGLWTLKMLAALFVDRDGKHPHTRTILRALKQLGLKLRNRPRRVVNSRRRETLSRTRRPGQTQIRNTRTPGPPAVLDPRDSKSVQA
jgi:hypothetical protein